MNRLLLVFLPLFIFAEGKPFIETNYKAKEEQWVGQKLDFYVELYSPTWFSGTPRFEIPEMRDAHGEVSQKSLHAL